MLHRDPLFFIIRDLYPVSPGHLLIIFSAERTDYFALKQAEKLHLPQLLAYGKRRIEQEFRHNNYTIEMNYRSGGQTVLSFHYHLITRYAGDMADPRRGIRQTEITIKPVIVI